MVPGQYRAGEIVEAGMTCLAMIALPMPLAFITAVADDHSAVAARTAHAIRPAMLTHKLKAFGLVQQAGEIDHVGYGHACAASSDNRITFSSDQIRNLVSALPRQSHHPGTRQEPCLFENGRKINSLHTTLQAGCDLQLNGSVRQRQNLPCSRLPWSLLRVDHLAL